MPETASRAPGIAYEAVGSAVLVIAGVAAASMAWTELALALLAGASLAAILLARQVAGGYDSFAAVFVAFFALYGLSGPLNAVTGWEDLPKSITQPYRTATFLLWFGLALTGLAAGLAIVGWRARRRAADASSPAVAASGAALPLFGSALALAALAGGFELINFLRVGGWDSILRGKAHYQSAVADLGLTLPSQIVSYFAVAAEALFLSLARREQGRIGRLHLLQVFGFLLLLSPLLMTTAVLTRRTEMIAWLMIAIVGFCWHSRLRRVSAMLFAAVVAVYVGSAGLLAARADLQQLRLDFLSDPAWGQNFRRFLNPGVGEFSAPFAVTSEAVTKMADMSPRLGRTYLAGVASAVPRFLWPGEKPRQIDMEIRDRLFPSYTGGATLESPGFSAILEARLNFGTAGIVVLFVLFGAAAAAFELLRRGGLPGAMLYLTLLPVAQTFHRSAFGPGVISVAAMTLALLAVFCLIHYPLAWWFSRKTTGAR